MPAAERAVARAAVEVKPAGAEEAVGGVEEAGMETQMETGMDRGGLEASESSCLAGLGPVLGSSLEVCLVLSWASSG